MPSAHPTTSWDFGLHHYDMAWASHHIRLDIAPALSAWQPLVAEVVGELDQLIATDLTIGPAVNNEPRIEFRSLTQTGAPDGPGVLGYAELYVSDDFSTIVGGRIGLHVDWQGQALATYVLRHELMHMLAATLDYTVLDRISGDPEQRAPGPLQTVMSYEADGRQDGFGAADIAWLQTLFGPSPDDDVIVGGPGAGNILGGTGDDIIYGNQGADWLYGNQGADTLFGGQDADWLHGGQGDDLLIGVKGADTLIGGLGQDTIVADANDVIIGSYGDLILMA
ncbi:MAG: hypothetical protein KI792_07480 [Alphaproteobacteria bacterium]|nr:hypothetical protein [Alphaproteobacteria bacterium SS10]